MVIGGGGDGMVDITVRVSASCFFLCRVERIEEACSTKLLYTIH